MAVLALERTRWSVGQHDRLSSAAQLRPGHLGSPGPDAASPRPAASRSPARRWRAHGDRVRAPVTGAQPRGRGTTACRDPGCRDRTPTAATSAHAAFSGRPRPPDRAEEAPLPTQAAAAATRLSPAASVSGALARLVVTGPVVSEIGQETLDLGTDLVRAGHRRLVRQQAAAAGAAHVSVELVLQRPHDAANLL